MKRNDLRPDWFDVARLLIAGAAILLAVTAPLWLHK